MVAPGRLTALLFSVLFVGCTTSYRFTVEEAKKLSTRTYDLALVPSRIAGYAIEVPIQDSASDTALVKSDSVSRDTVRIRMIEKLFRFNSDGGKLQRPENRLEGVDDSGKLMSIPFDSIVILQFRGANGSFSQLPVHRAIKLYDSVLAVRSSNVKLPKISNWDRVKFDGRGASLDVAAAALTGTAESGRTVNVPFSEVIYVQYTEVNPYKTLRFFTIAGLLAILSLGPIHRAF